MNKSLKTSIRNYIALGVLPFFAMAVIFCCCITKEVSAAAKMCSQHKAQPCHSQNNHSKEECPSCKQLTSLVEKTDVFSKHIEHSILKVFAFNHSFQTFKSSSLAFLTEGPPHKDASSPLYLQTHQLRL